jgi:hypothetical protein
MPDDTPDLTDRIKEVAQGPAQASDAAGGMQQHNPSSVQYLDLVEVDKYLAQKRAAKRRLGGLRIFKFRPPGAA